MQIGFGGFKRFHYVHVISKGIIYMSKGPGRVERTIANLFTNNPTKTFLASELAAIVYPGLNQVEKKHRVSVLRAARKVALRLNWLTERKWKAGGELIYCNRLNAVSLAVGSERCHRERVSPAEIEAELKEEELRQGGKYWRKMEINRLELAGDTAAAERMRNENTARAMQKLAEGFERIGRLR